MSIKFLTALVIVIILTSTSDAWWGSRSSSSSSSSSSSGGWVRSIGTKAKEKAKYAKDFAGGSKDMLKAYTDMRTSNWKNSDKYFHARGNSDAAKRGQGGKDAAKIISDARETYGKYWKGDSDADIAADQAANEWGRNGGDPNKYRPKGLPKKY